MAPVSTSIIMATAPFFTLNWSTPSARYFSRMLCTVSSMVSTRLLPSWASTYCSYSKGISVPRAFREVISRPAVPRSWVSYWSSNPSRPWPSVPVKPSTVEATVP